MIARCQKRFLAPLAVLLGAMSVVAQSPDMAAVSVSHRETTRWQVGIVVEAVGGPCMGLYGTVPVPIDWPEQKVRVVDEQKSPWIGDVGFRVLDRGVKQMLVHIPRIPSGGRAEALLTLEIDRFVLAAPEDPDELVIPKRPPRELRIYLGTSPYIESRHRKIRDLARELTDDSLSAWKQIEVFYDHVREHVTYMNGPLKGALAALRDGNGDCEELTSLFIALCRAHKVPARTVWVPDHCYPEFYLENAEGQGTWFPCQAAGTRAFGTMPELRPILQKGDNFKVPEKKERQRYVAEYLRGNSRASGGKPKVSFVRKKIST
ncbi:MAG TPA: transglutaminase-like domain-containing protein [Pirellulaceae bacterium]